MPAQNTGEVVLELVASAQGLSEALQNIEATLTIHRARPEGVELTIHVVNHNPDTIRLINPLDMIQYRYLTQQGIPIGQLHAAPRLLINEKGDQDKVVRENFAAIEILEDGVRKETDDEIARHQIDIGPGSDYQLNLTTLKLGPTESAASRTCHFVLYLSLAKLDGESIESCMLQSGQVDIALPETTPSAS